MGDKPLGVTAPLSTSLPTDAENLSSNALVEELRRQNNYESATDTQRRYEPDKQSPLRLLITSLQDRSAQVSADHHRRVCEASEPGARSHLCRGELRWR